MNKKPSDKQRTIFFLINVSSFAVIFFLLGLIIVQLLNQTAFRETDQTLIEMTQDPGFVEREIARYEDNKQNPSSNNFAEEPPVNPSPSSNEFNTQIILWSENGEILNEQALGGRFSELRNLRLNTEDMNAIQTVSMENNTEDLMFHSITQAYNDEEIAYIQVLSNVNQINHALQNFRLILISCMVIFWLLSIAVSYWLSSLSMKPILKAWKKQQEFVENASHELRTPLTIIQNRLDGLFRMPNHTILDESENIAQALKETRRLKGLTSDLLMIARSDAKQITLEKTTVNSTEFLGELISPFKEKAAFDNKHFDFVSEETLAVTIDTKKIYQVFVILLDNALKYTRQEDTIRVTSAKNNKMWEVHVTNTGPSISKEAQSQIFDRFYREDKSRSKETGGYGLGLSIAKQIVEEHTGKITVSNLTPEGTDFCIKLPLN